MVELKCSVYANGVRMEDQAAGARAFKEACLAPRRTPPLLVAILNAVAAGHVTPEHAARSLGFEPTHK